MVNILPILGVTGFLILVAQYQIELFWVGLAFNATGILYIVPKVVKATTDSLHFSCLGNCYGQCGGSGSCSANQ